MSPHTQPAFRELRGPTMAGKLVTCPGSYNRMAWLRAILVWLCAIWLGCVWFHVMDKMLHLLPVLDKFFDTCVILRKLLYKCDPKIKWSSTYFTNHLKNYHFLFTVNRRKTPCEMGRNGYFLNFRSSNESA